MDRQRQRPALNRRRLIVVGAIALLGAGGGVAVAQSPTSHPAGGALAGAGSTASVPRAQLQPNASRPRLQMTNPVRVGSMVSIRISGFPPGARIGGTVQPKSAEGGNGVGRRLFAPRRADSNGGLVVRLRFPRTYLRCSGGAGPCNAYPFEHRELILVSAGDSTSFVTVTRRVVVLNRR